MMMFKADCPDRIADHGLHRDRERDGRPDRQASGQHEPENACKDIGCELTMLSP